MTTFTTEDRIHAEKDGSFTINASPPHIVDSGASVMIKNLTNSEIWELWEQFDPSQDAWVSEEQVIEFARAILKKASEK